MRVYISLDLFQFTQPKRAATVKSRLAKFQSMSFNSRSPSGLRPSRWLYQWAAREFQFTQPKRAATGGLFDVSPVFRVSIHAAQAGCDNRVSYQSKVHRVSIHAAQAGCDRSFFYHLTIFFSVSIHAAQAGCDNSFRVQCFPDLCFNSRSPSGLRRVQHWENRSVVEGFNSRSPSGLRPKSSTFFTA